MNGRKSFFALVGLQYLRFLNVSSCRYVSDLSKILPVRETLEELHMHNCWEVKDLSPLFELRYIPYHSNTFPRNRTGFTTMRITCHL